MSGLVFVRDLQGARLMPMAPAYARVLLQRGKAQLIDHPTFTILRLAHDVHQPVLRPILLAIVLGEHIAELFLLADSRRGALPLLRCAIDLANDILPFLPIVVEPIRQSSNRDCICKSHDTFIKSSVARHVKHPQSAEVIDTTVTLLAMLLPISHITFYKASKTDRLNRLTPIQPYSGEYTTNVAKHDPDVIARLGVALDTFRERPAAYALHVVAVSLQTYSSRTRSEIVATRLYRLHRTGLPVLGYIFSSIPELVLYLPRAISSQGVVWQNIPVDSSADLRVIQDKSIAFLPMAKQDSVQL